MPAKKANKSVGSQRNKKDNLSAGDRASRRYLTKLKPFIEKARRSSMDTDHLLMNCVKASFVKAYEFAQFAHGRLRDEFAFHCVGGLRSICEDLIVLKFASELRPEDQTTLLMGNMLQSVDASIRKQVPFFATFRFGQPVLNRGYDDESLAKIKNDLINFWKANGWTRKTWPATSWIAEKVGPGTMDVMYDYIYRLTSGAVHFNTRALLRTGWGIDREICEFSTVNMGLYYSQFCRVYGVFLLTIYFEFFGINLEMDDVVAGCVKRLRRTLVMKNRWPEMITFEEMNIKVPPGKPYGMAFQKMLADEIEDGFISGAEKMKNNEEQESGEEVL